MFLVGSEKTRERKRDRIPPGQIVTKKWPVLQGGKVQHIDIKSWEFRIFGLVEKELKLNFTEFLKLPRVDIKSDVHCVTTWSMLDNNWHGVSSRVIKDLINILQEAKYVMIHAEKNFTTNLSLDDFFQPDVLFALKHNDEDLTVEHGYPVRLVVPRLYFWKSAKWVTGIEFMSENKPGFWESRGYHIRGDPWKEERYST